MNASYTLLSLRTIFVLIVALVTGVTSLSATVPEAPVLDVSVVTPPGTPNRTIRLEWRMSPQSPPPTGYRIYVAKGPGPDGTIGEFVEFATTEETFHEVSNISGGIYYIFHVTAYNNDGESSPSNQVKGVVDGDPTDPSTPVTFISEPPREVALGSTYSYKAEAIAAEGGTIRYKITGSPLGAPIPDAEGMTVDPVSGIVEWTPTVQGSYAAAIVAYLESDTLKNAMQVLIINVKAPPCAVIQGTVRDSSGILREYGWITAISVDGANGADWNSGASAELVDGQYSLDVPEGTYVLYLKHAQVGAVWYRNGNDMSDADRITVACGDRHTADFFVTLPPQPTKFVVSGRVTAKDDGRGVSAVVHFTTGKVGGRPGDPNTGVIYPGGFAVATDPDGRYSIELTDEYNYLAEAIPTGDDLLPQYYDNVSNPTEATLVTAAAAGTPVDFALGARPVFNNIIGGSVYDSTGAIVASQVIAIRFGGPDGVGDPAINKEFARSATTSDDGTYTLRNLVPGAYVIFAIPNDRNHLPGYFVAGGTAALSWKDASVLTVDETTTSTLNDIILGVRDGAKGFAKFGGYVTIAPGSARSGSGSAGSSAGSDPLPGTFIHALDSTNRVGDYTFSDPSGWFELTELAPVSYRIVADKVGYITEVIDTKLDYSGQPNVGKDISMGRATSSVDVAAAVDGSLAIHPNPAGRQLSIRFDAVAGRATLTIYDLLGRTVFTGSIDATDGANHVDIDLSALGTGQYRAQIRSTTLNVSAPFTIAR